MIRIGIDVGGTGIQIGVVDKNHRIIHESSIPTHTDIPFEEQLKQKKLLGKLSLRKILMNQKILKK